MMRKPYLYFSLGQAISRLGSFLTTFSISWIILQGQHSSRWLATYMSYSLFLFALLSFVAGKLVDALSGRKVLLWADGLGMSCLVALAIMEATGHASLGAYFGVTFVTQFVGTVIMVGTQSALGDFGKGVEVARAQTVFETMGRIIAVASPVLSGLLISRLPRWGVFATDSLTYAVSLAGTLAFLPRKAVPPGACLRREFARQEANPGRMLEKSIVVLVAFVVVVNLLHAPVMLIWPILADMFARGPFFMGVISSSFALGGIGGGLWVLRQESVGISQCIRSTGIVGLGFGGLWLGRIGGPYCLAIPSFILGFGFGSMSGPIMSILHERIQDDGKGSFFGWLGMIGQIGQPLVVMISGVIVQELGVWFFAQLMAAVAILTAGILRCASPVRLGLALPPKAGPELCLKSGLMCVSESKKDAETKEKANEKQGEKHVCRREAGRADGSAGHGGIRASGIRFFRWPRPLQDHAGVGRNR